MRFSLQLFFEYKCSPNRTSFVVFPHLKVLPFPVFYDFPLLAFFFFLVHSQDLKKVMAVSYKSLPGKVNKPLNFTLGAMKLQVHISLMAVC